MAKDERDRLTFDELLDDEHVPESPVHNDYFLPIGDSAQALHQFEGTLTVPRTVMDRFFV